MKKDGLRWADAYDANNQESFRFVSTIVYTILKQIAERILTALGISATRYYRDRDTAKAAALSFSPNFIYRDNDTGILEYILFSSIL